jgi:hypothetical protein
MSAPPVRLILGATLLLIAGLAVSPHAQQRPPPTGPVLREAEPDEVWITRPEIGTPPVLPVSNRIAAAGEAPLPPVNLVVTTEGLSIIKATWAAAADVGSNYRDYAFAIGTSTVPGQEGTVRGWQSTGGGTHATVNIQLTAGQTYYFNVISSNLGGTWSPVVRSQPLTPTPPPPQVYGAPSNQMHYLFASQNFDAAGKPTTTWPEPRLSDLTNFLNLMLPILQDLYGPPAVSYTVSIVRDLRQTGTAVFYPSVDEIHMGDTATYQLLTHEMIHAWRRNRLIASDANWNFDTTLSGFEEGFAQGVSYLAMTEFARRHPSFGLSQKIYQSSNEWDYDFQNSPELRTRDFWSQSGGTLSYWVRYEMAAAGIAKMDLEYPGFPRAFNAEYYRRLTADNNLRPSRALVKEIIQTIVPRIEGQPASSWIDAQNVFDCRDHAGKKVWLFHQHYPWTDFLIFNRTHFYETFSNGSDWAIDDGQGGYRFHNLNGSLGSATLKTSAGATIWQRALQITPTANPPAFYGFGSDEANLTTQSTIFPWPGGDAGKYATGLTTLDLYQLTVQFSAPQSTPVSNTYYQVIGAPLKSAHGVWGGVIGASGGSVYLRHRSETTGQPILLTNAAFWGTPTWSGLAHPETSSVDSIPGIVDVIYQDAAGVLRFATRNIGYGNGNGSQAFLFDASRMSSTPALYQPFTDDPIVAGVTPIRPVHILEMRTRIAALRSRYGLPVYVWSDPVLTAGVTPPRPAHVADLRAALAPVYLALGLGAPGYTDPVLTVGTPIRMAHIAELRAAIAGLE